MERVIARGAEVLAALLVLADTVILFVGVVSRYALNSPITWTDELASTLFLWMVMLGSVVALDRGEHMRLVLGRGWMRPDWQRRLGAFGVVVTLLFVLLVLGPAWRYQANQAAIETPALGISAQWHALSLLAGFALILLRRSAGWWRATACATCWARSWWRRRSAPRCGWRVRRCWRSEIGTCWCSSCC